MITTKEKPLRYGVRAVMTLDDENPRQLTPDTRVVVKKGHIVSQAQNGPMDKGGVVTR